MTVGALATRVFLECGIRESRERQKFKNQVIADFKVAIREIFHLSPYDKKPNETKAEEDRFMGKAEASPSPWRVFMLTSCTNICSTFVLILTESVSAEKASLCDLLQSRLHLAGEFQPVEFVTVA